MLVAEPLTRSKVFLQFPPKELTLPKKNTPASLAPVRDSRLSPEPRSGERLAAMDALRGGAMLLGIFVHAAISYMPTNLEQLFWGIREKQTSPRSWADSSGGFMGADCRSSSSSRASSPFSSWNPGGSPAS